jgi:hypothetical protein
MTSTRWSRSTPITAAKRSATSPIDESPTSNRDYHSSPSPLSHVLQRPHPCHPSRYSWCSTVNEVIELPSDSPEISVALPSANNGSTGKLSPACSHLRPSSRPPFWYGSRASSRSKRNDEHSSSTLHTSFEVRLAASSIPTPIPGACPSHRPLHLHGSSLSKCRATHSLPHATGWTPMPTSPRRSTPSFCPPGARMALRLGEAVSIGDPFSNHPGFTALCTVLRRFGRTSHVVSERISVRRRLRRMTSACSSSDASGPRQTAGAPFCTKVRHSLSI